VIFSFSLWELFFSLWLWQLWVWFVFVFDGICAVLRVRWPRDIGRFVFVGNVVAG